MNPLDLTPAGITSLAGKQVAQRLTVLYVLALSTIATLSIAGQVLVQYALHQHHGDSTVVNIAGRQRMLSQKLAKESLIAVNGTTGAERDIARNDLRETLALWQRSHLGLLRGDVELELPGKLSNAVAQQFDKIAIVFDTIDAAANELLESHDSELSSAARNDALARILTYEPRFLQGMNDIVFALDQESQDRVRRLQRIELWLLATTLVVLIIEGALVFRPAAAKIRETLSSLHFTGEALRESRDRAEEASRHKTQFLANMSHEMRTPLHVILGTLELAEDEATFEKATGYVTTIRGASNSLLHLVNDLLDLSQVEAGQLDLRYQSVNLTTFTRELVDSFYSLASTKELSLSLDFPANPVVGKIDETRLRQVLTNLIANAVKFTERGSVTIRLRCHDVGGVPHGEWAIIDTGPGIAKQERAKVFESFYQIDGSSQRRFGGVGLGLAISTKLVERMQGCLCLESELGRGSTFTVTLPLAPESNDSTSEKSAASDLTTSKIPRGRVLVVDDLPDARQLAAAMLRQLGQQVTTADSAEAALKLLESESYDLVLMDVQMPGMDGLEAVRRWRKQEQSAGSQRLPIIALTADALPHDRERCQTAGCDDYLAKPFDSRALSRVLSDRLAKSAALKLAEPFCFDPRPLLQRVQGRHDLVAGLIEAFATSCDATLESLRIAITNRDASQVRLLAHRLKGQLQNFDAHDAVSCAQKIESMSLNNDLSLCELHFEQLTTLITIARRSLADYRQLYNGGDQQ